MASAGHRVPHNLKPLTCGPAAVACEGTRCGYTFLLKALLSVGCCLRRADSRQRCNFVPSLLPVLNTRASLCAFLILPPASSFFFGSVSLSVHSLIIVLSPSFLFALPLFSPLIPASSLPGRTPTWKSTSQRIAMQTSSPMTTPEWCSPLLTVRAHVST